MGRGISGDIVTSTGALLILCTSDEAVEAVKASNLLRPCIFGIRAWMSLFNGRPCLHFGLKDRNCLDKLYNVLRQSV